MGCVYCNCPWLKREGNDYVCGRCEETQPTYDELLQQIDELESG